MNKKWLKVFGTVAPVLAFVSTVMANYVSSKEQEQMLAEQERIVDEKIQAALAVRKEES